jgi:hypothetical protein
LAMSTQGNVKGDVDESFLPGFKVCSEDAATPVRSVAARVMGQHMVAGKEPPNPEAVELLIKLAKDESSDVRYNAIYYGLSEIKNKSDEIVALLVDIAVNNREPGLNEKIAKSLQGSNEQTVKLLDNKLKTDNAIGIFEIYQTLTGKEPPNASHYLEMPSSRPMLFVFKSDGKEAEAFKSSLESELKSAGIERPEVFTSGAGDNYALLLKTYLTKDRLLVEKHFADHETFVITQSMWLTPQLEIQINTLRIK